MNEAIKVLEALGRQPQLACVPAALDALLAATSLSEAERHAIRHADARELGALLGGRPTMVCALFPAEPEQQPAPEGDEPEDAPEQAPEQIRGLSLH